MANDEFQAEVASVTCETCPLRTLPEVWWEQNRRDDLTPFEVGQALAGRIYAVQNRMNAGPRGDYLRGSAATHELEEAHNEVARLHTIHPAGIGDVDDNGMVDVGPRRHTVVYRAATEEKEHYPLETFGAGVMAFAGCFRAVERGTCRQGVKELPGRGASESLFPIMSREAGVNVLRQLAAHGSDEAVMRKADELREAMITMTEESGTLSKNRKKLEELGFFKEASDRDPAFDRQFLLAMAQVLTKMPQE